MQQTTTDKILNFLAAHPVLKVNIIEAELKLPPTTIAQAKKRGIPPKHVDKILAYLANYGMKK